MMALYDYFPFLFRPAPRYVTEAGEPVYGVLAEYDSAAAVYRAAEMVRDAGYTRWDVYAPFPIHGIEEAMGIRSTRVPLVVAGAGFAGAGLAWLFQWWTTAADYPLVVQGKPYDAWEPFVPVIFEVGVLLAAFASLLGMLVANGLPRYHHPLFRKTRFLRVSQDRFMIAIEADDPRFDPQATRRLLQESGAGAIELVED